MLYFFLFILFCNIIEFSVTGPQLWCACLLCFLTLVSRSVLHWTNRQDGHWKRRLQIYSAQTERLSTQGGGGIPLHSTYLRSGPLFCYCVCLSMCKFRLFLVHEISAAGEVHTWKVSPLNNDFQFRNLSSLQSKNKIDQFSSPLTVSTQLLHSKCTALRGWQSLSLSKKKREEALGVW